MLSGLGWGYTSFAGLASGLAFAAYTAFAFFRQRGRRLTTRQLRNLARSRRSFQTLGGAISVLVVLLIGTFWPKQFFMLFAAFVAGWAWLGMPLLALQAHRREGVFEVSP
jgi:hypothetical protein